MILTTPMIMINYQNEVDRSNINVSEEEYIIVEDIYQALRESICDEGVVSEAKVDNIHDSNGSYDGCDDEDMKAHIKSRDTF